MESSIQNLTEADIWSALDAVKDPEIPVISVAEMGMITGVKIQDKRAENQEMQTRAEVTMTPTFVGCPAINVIRKDIYDAVKKMGFDEVVVHVDLEKAWSSDRMSADAKKKLEQFGIAPPATMDDSELTAEMLDRVRCPHCGSADTTLRSAFGSTLCRAIRFCFACKQGFEQFKPL